MPDSGRERYRRAALRLPDHRGGGRRTGHAAVFRLDQVVELGDFQEGGGFPLRFLVDVAYPTLGVTDPARVLHICSGSVLAPFTIDRRQVVRPAVVADARALPFLDASFEWAIADPPYSRQWARALYGISARQYPTPGGIVREAMRVLRPGGRLGLLHYMVPPFGRGERLIGVWGITIGPGSTIRAWSVLEKNAQPALPMLPGPAVRRPAYTVAPSGPREPAGSADRVRDPVRDRQPSPAGPELARVTEPGTDVRTAVRRLSSRPCACGCGEAVEPAPNGRPRQYAGAAHRQRAYRRRQERGPAENTPQQPTSHGHRTAAARGESNHFGSSQQP